jgi:hypothetical protein
LFSYESDAFFFFLRIFLLGDESLLIELAAEEFPLGGFRDLLDMLNFESAESLGFTGDA